ncbi:uncharacterized protein LOC110920323 [Helianthus annuus]|uniref:uncharacterized protein LOC110920323 n=1 Tax=Helianthus annuus TaxID=4232 RepID=UPI000B908F77|nr:uncharacterized protein LOC110920323 [Helianthus annuus]
MHIEQNFASVAHPQANGQVERANRSIVEGIKKCLGKEGVSWADELPHVLWAHRTMPKTSTRETPFSLTYGLEAVIPAEVGIPTPRMRQSQEENEQQLRLNLDLAEERRELVAIREAKYKKKSWKNITTQRSKRSVSKKEIMSCGGTMLVWPKVQERWLQSGKDPT